MKAFLIKHMKWIIIIHKVLWYGMVADGLWGIVTDFLLPQFAQDDLILRQFLGVFGAFAWILVALALWLIQLRYAPKSLRESWKKNDISRDKMRLALVDERSRSLLFKAHTQSFGLCYHGLMWLAMGVMVFEITDPLHILAGVIIIVFGSILAAGFFYEHLESHARDFDVLRERRVFHRDGIVTSVALVAIVGIIFFFELPALAWFVAVIYALLIFNNFYMYACLAPKKKRRTPCKTNQNLID